MVSPLEEVLRRRMLGTQPSVQRQNTQASTYSDNSVSSSGMPPGPFRPYGTGPRFIQAGFGDSLDSSDRTYTPQANTERKIKKDEAEAAANYQNDVDVDSIAANLNAKASSYGPLKETVGIGPHINETIAHIPFLQEWLGDEIPWFNSPKNRQDSVEYRGSMRALQNDVVTALKNKSAPGVEEQNRTLKSAPNMGWLETPDDTTGKLNALHTRLSEVALDTDKVLQTQRMTPNKRTELIQKREAAVRGVKRIEAMLNADSAASKLAEPKSKQERDALPQGTLYKAPDGSVMRKR